jgi:hypothetical protein
MVLQAVPQKTSPSAGLDSHSHSPQPLQPPPVPPSVGSSQSNSSHGPEIFQRTGEQMAIKVYNKKILRSLQGRTQENPLMEITALQFIGQ